MGAVPIFDVVIVGFGPSGAVAAALLGHAGHRVMVCERQAEVYPKPRAIALDHEILRTFQRIGIADEIAPHTQPFTDSCFHGADGGLIRRMTMVEPPYPQAWTPSMVFTQPPVEAALRAAVAKLPNVEVDLAADMVALQQGAEFATLTLADGRRVAARYVIGCDGASSRVRSELGIGLDDLGFDEPWLVVDVLANAHGLASLPTTSMQYCEPERPCTYVIGPGAHRRWEISLKPGEDPAQAATPEGTWALLRRWITHEGGTLWRQASYRFHALVADRWRSGRVFLAGDAAHQQPPFLGQGMCQGIRDVSNLAWKLDAVLRGEAGEALLDSYEIERSAHVRALTRRLIDIGAVICERDPARARARDARLRNEAGTPIRPTPRQDVLPRLEAGALSARPHPARGTLFPQPWIAGAGGALRMDDTLAPGWLLVTSDAAPSPAAPHGLPNLQTRRLPLLRETEGVLAQWFERHACTAALVRPDHHVFGVATDPAALRHLLVEAAAALAATPVEVAA